jgi:hypothetical protein
MLQIVPLPDIIEGFMVASAPVHETVQMDLAGNEIM